MFIYTLYLGLFRHVCPPIRPLSSGVTRGGMDVPTFPMAKISLKKERFPGFKRMCTLIFPGSALLATLLPLRPCSKPRVALEKG